MSSFYDDASLVMIPSGYKNAKIYCEKPTDGSGDLTFTRASNATRVASNGLIEKVRTNLLLQSNTFSTTWLFSGTGTVTQGAADPFGGTTAWTLAKTAANTFLYQSTAGITGSVTFSVYAKAGTVDQIQLRHDQPSPFFSYFDLTLGTAVGATGCVATIVSVGSGWYRCSIAGTSATPNNIRIYPASGGSISGTTGNILIYGAQGETGDIATQYIATTTAAVSVGPVSGLPRLDYLNSSCPRLLLEGQRTNDIINNTALNNYTATRATWGVNVAISPTGDQDAEKLIEDTTASNSHFFGIGGNYVSGTAYTWSIYVKADGREEVLIQAGNQAVLPLNCLFNLSTQTVSNSGSGTGAIINAGNGWYRLVVRNVTALATGGTNYILFLRSGGTVNYTGNGTSGVLVWGAQREVGTYETSLIPTLSTSVTRVADAASKTGISGLIGDSAGFIFGEVSGLTNSYGAQSTILSVTDGTASTNSIQFSFNATSGYVTPRIYRAGSTIFVQDYFLGTLTNNFKFVISYGAGRAVCYINGVNAKDVSGLTFFADGTLTRVGMDTGAGGAPCFGNIKQILIGTSALTDAQCIELTTL